MVRQKIAPPDDGTSRNKKIDLGRQAGRFKMHQAARNIDESEVFMEILLDCYEKRDMDKSRAWLDPRTTNQEERPMTTQQDLFNDSPKKAKHGQEVAIKKEKAWEQNTGNTSLSFDLNPEELNPHLYTGPQVVNQMGQKVVKRSWDVLEVFKDPSMSSVHVYVAEQYIGTLDSKSISLNSIPMMLNVTSVKEFIDKNVVDLFKKTVLKNLKILHDVDASSRIARQPSKEEIIEIPVTSGVEDLALSTNSRLKSLLLQTLKVEDESMNVDHDHGNEDDDSNESDIEENQPVNSTNQVWPGKGEKWDKKVIGVSTREEIVGLYFTEVDEGVLMCLRCHERVKERDGYRHHRNAHPKLRSKCTICQQDVKNLRTHIKKMHELNLCRYCSKTFKTQMEITYHVRICHESQLCPYCGKTLLDIGSHISLYHVPEEEMCDHPGCGKVMTRAALRGHRAKHARNLAIKNKLCSFCGMAFALDSYLRNHIRSVHLQERKYPCKWEDCNKAFKTTNALKVHTRIHTGSMPWECVLCDYKCRQQAALSWHMNRQHANTNESRNFLDLN